MAPQTATRMTYEEFMALPADEYRRAELIEGELVLNPAPFFRHQIIAGNIYHAFRNYLAEHRIGSTIMAPADVVLSRENVVQPDVMVFLGENLSMMQWKNAQRAPDIAVEVLSEGTHRHDTVTKRRLYARHGVREMWIVDPEEASVTIIRNGQEDVITDTITTSLLPGFAMPLRDVFAEEP
ncbi:MAG TPA: Uma2 family endonuclease [Thermoanaerobaculia bacterium]|nr:Uma2 family endonuclease [Thermoanaerobaculia bacterium]